MKHALTGLMLFLTATCQAQFRPASLNYGNGGFNDGSLKIYQPIYPNDGPAGAPQRQEYSIYRPSPSISSWPSGKWLHTITNAVGGNIKMTFTSHHVHNTPAVSISLWIKPTELNAATAYTLAAKANADISARCYVFYFWGGSLYFNTLGANGQTPGYTPSSPLNVWAHVVATYSAADGSKVYWNGALVDSKAASSVALTNTSNDLWIGLERNSTGPFKGRLDNIRIYDRVINASEVGQIFALEWNDPRE